MKTVLISTASAIFIFSSAFSHEATESPRVQLHTSTNVTHHRAMQLASVTIEDGARCTTRYFPMARGDGSRTVRKSVDCEE
jgi:hypothetical protein